MKNCFLFFIISLLFSFPGYSQCNPTNQAFKSGEVVEYEVNYNWGFIWVSAGAVSFSVSDTLYQGKEQYHFVGIGNSIPRWDWMYKVRDRFDAIADKQTMKPVYFDRNTNEGGYAVREIYHYDYEKGIIHSNITTSKKSQVQKKIKIEGCVFDLLSMIYIARNIDFTGIKENEKVPIQLVLDGEIHDVFIRYRGTEQLKTKSGEVYECVKFTTMLIEGSMFSAGEDMTVWVTNDLNKIPLQVEAKILVGSVKASMTSTKGLRNPMMKPIK